MFVVILCRQRHVGRADHWYRGDLPGVFVCVFECATSKTVQRSALGRFEGVASKKTVILLVNLE